MSDGDIYWVGPIDWAYVLTMCAPFLALGALIFAVTLA